MKIKIFILFILPILLIGSEAKKNPIVYYELDCNRVYEIRTFFNTGVTTVMFPAELDAIHAANVALNTAQEDSPADFLLAYRPGSYYFSIRAIRPGAQGSLNIVFAGKTYIIKLTENSIDPMSSVTFTGGGSSSSKRASAYVRTPSFCKGLIDRAKIWEILKDKYPNDVTDTEVNDAQYISDYDTFTATITRIWRWSKYDAMVFAIKLKNNTDEPLYYIPRDTALAVGDRKFFATIIDASGEMPPKSESLIFVALAGDNVGLRNLAAQNDWKVLLFAAQAKRRSKEL